MKGADHTAFTATWRALALAFTRTLREGPGLLEVARPDGTARRIAVYYSQGWDGQGRTATGITWDSAVLTLWCEDPYWVDVQVQSVHRETGTQVDYLDPYPSVSSSQVLGETTVTNPGDVDVWPTWTITGPATSITFTRGDTGDAFTLDMEDTVHGALLAGETVTVSTDPPRVRSDSGEVLTPGLNWPEAVLWSIPPGQTPVTFQLNGAEAGSAVDLTYYPRYETA
ncbi:phage tail family protein [Streptomyces sp. AVP053U2]|uniref:phage tail family protein n=1 Tax=Streptomyces sp. AVP053U2 TaxID=1737066 RepID=UPI00210D5CD3|nr:phage tail family protein [Streptomyces sp. AVP053U2]